MNGCSRQNPAYRPTQLFFFHAAALVLLFFGWLYLKPSVTISDDWFVASTSRNQALDLVGARVRSLEEVGQRQERSVLPLSKQTFDGRVAEPFDLSEADSNRSDGPPRRAAQEDEREAGPVYRRRCTRLFLLGWRNQSH